MARSHAVSSGNPIATNLKLDKTRKCIFHDLTEWIRDLGIPPLILMLTAAVIVAPFVLPPVKNWKDASLQERISVSAYFFAVAVVVFYFIGYIAVK